MRTNSASQKAFVCDVLDRAFNNGDLGAIDATFSADARIHDPGLELRGPAELRKGLSALRTVFPDFQFSVEDALVDDDRVAIRYRATGTHRATFLGIPPTGRRIEYTGIVILRLALDKVVEFWAQPDQLGILKQLKGNL
ncbi:MAG: ester cyclase [Chloroflexi bacterium]|nr:ester cyclase [Chloroflexota bacterium]